ncbi:diguanylate cyclase GGDEF domain protein [Asticcacaulis biprosthecium C19]|uniref:Diguanylate cyclase GGDEF domain protein n=1 Tax=Asticcacaulis biprosthecium C19 TaxID=715226 RepID=F4QS83_9CAUL|nr:EAL domain-containing protein [Asticcacaulis biprosthecium]EGF89603.1 diguanylate cyclase GGDEF domain protein [Asticcacaulis biprosthecium C19]
MTEDIAPAVLSRYAARSAQVSQPLLRLWYAISGETPSNDAWSGEEMGVTRRDEAVAMAQVTRRYLLIAAVFFSYMCLSRIFRETGMNMVILAVTSAVTAVTAIVFQRLSLRHRDDPRLPEIGSGIVNLLMIANPVAYQLLHFDQSRMINFLFLFIMFAISGASFRVLLASSLACYTAMMTVGMAKMPDGMTVYAWTSLGGLAMAIGMGSVVRLTLYRAVRARVVADRLREEAQMLADCDVLTALPNRRSFFRELERNLAVLRARKVPFDLALIDLDGFKPINDLYGHSVGDHLLVEVGERLRQICGITGLPARMGGDEFAIVLAGQRSEDELKAFGAQLCDALRQTYHLSGVNANISGSVGFVHCDDASVSTSQLLERADYALYYAKQNMRGAPVIFTERHEAEMRDFSLVDQTLRGSDLDAEFSIVFQPQVDIVENRTVSFEALARWDSARLGVVRPDIFIKAAERSGLITQITQILLSKALKHMAEWPEEMRASFNLSARDIRSATAIANICDTVERSGIDPRRIEFEITETAMLTDFDQACEALSRLKVMGARIAIDDFGSGYSSLGYLHRLPVDKIKIDRSFVVQLVKHGTTLKIIKTIIDLCRNLHLECVVEGVETEAELNNLRQVRARYIQGYVFSKPMPAGEVAGFLATEGERLSLAG